MGFWDFLNKPSGNTGSFHFSPSVQYLGAQDVGELWTQVNGMSPAEMFRTQPHLRTVVTFLARNIAQLGVHCFERVSDTDRRRDSDSAAAKALRSPDTNMTTYELIFALVVDMALYDVGYWFVGPSTLVPGGTMLRRLPPAWVSPVMANAFEVDYYRVSTDGKVTEVPAANVLAFNGFSPANASGSSPTIVALKSTLFEQVEAAKYRNQVWTRGGRVSSVLERPADAPEWSDAARESFREDWYSKFTGSGPKAGGTPILEDGMKLTRVDFNAQEQQYVEGAKLALATVAAAFHVNPTMVGQLDNASYSNVREFRRMLYGDTLGPMLAQIESRLNTFLLPMLGMDGSKFYLEFNIAEKLQGSFEEQAAVMSTLVGRPIMTADEGRSRFNLPAIGGDAEDLVTPLNVLLSNQSSPRDGVTEGGGGSLPTTEVVESVEPEIVTTPSGYTPAEVVALVGAAATLIRSGFAPVASLIAVGLDPVEHLGLLPVTVQRPQAVENVDTEVEDALKIADEIRRKAMARALKSKAAAPDTHQAKYEQALRAFFKRQGAAVRSSLGSKAVGDWWDGERWDRELSEDLFKLALLTSETVAKSVLSSVGFGPDKYDPERTLAFLKAVALRTASSINDTTRDQIKEALRDEDPTAAVANVYEVSEQSRTSQIAKTAITAAAGFGTVEAARQNGGNTKTWITGPNPRPSHARMDGETVPIEDDFSIGLPWPGAPGDPDDTAGCNCNLRVNFP